MPTYVLRRRCATVAVLLGCSLLGCAKGKLVGTGPSSPGGNPGGPTGNSTGGAGGTFSITLNTTTSPANGGADGTTQVVICDGGGDCTCPPFNVAVIGTPGKWGANPDGDPDTALQEWLNTSSAGTARVNNFTNRRTLTLTATFLSTYNVIILASLSDDSNTGPLWTFTDDEVAAFRAWVEGGGGVISLTGYSGNGQETAPVNQLIGFSGVTYNTDDVRPACTAPDYRVCGCAGTTSIVAEWNRTDSVIANLSKNVTWIGFEGGRTINAPADAHVAATIDGTKNVLVGKLVGKGRVLAFGDEWITYTSQWTGVGNPSASDPSCKDYMPQDDFQTSQFWYNMIKWSQPNASCFAIVNVDIW
jgi:uncharacterized membrane protein